MCEAKCKQIGKLQGERWERMHDLCRRVYSPSGLSPTIPTMGGGHQDPKIIVPEATKKGYDEASIGDSINMAFSGSKTRRGRVGHGVAQTLTTSDAQQVVVEPMSEYRFYQQAIETLCENDCEEGDTIDAYNKRVNKDGVSPAITTRPDGFKTAILPVVKADILYEKPLERKGWHHKACEVLNVNGITTCLHCQSNNLLQKIKEEQSYRIRKLTPRECFRLMGVKKDDYERAARHQSVSSQYHLAGDSIVTTCLMAIFGELLLIDYNAKINELTEGIRDAD